LISYTDGLQIDVIKITNGTFPAARAEYRDDFKKGQPYAVMTIRVTNGSGKTVDLVGIATVTYGPDGQEAKTTSMIKTSPRAWGANRSLGHRSFGSSRLRSDVRRAAAICEG
jgi:hypothetical protein